MSDYRRAVARLLDKSRDESDWAASATLREEAVRIADTHRDLDLAYESRKLFIESCLMADRCEEMLAAFAWCLAQMDREPDRFWWDAVLWEYRWVISVLPSFPSISRLQIDSMLADMTKRYRDVGASMRAIHVLRRVIAIDMGDRKMASEAARAIRRSRIDFLADSTEAEQAFNKGYLVFLNRTDAIIKITRPMLRQPPGDGHFFGYACADILLPLLKRKKVREAMAAHERGYPYTRRNVRYLESAADHIAFLGLTDNFAPATKMFQRHAREAFAAPNLLNRLKFLIDVLPLFDRMIKVGEKSIKARLPEACPLSAMNGKRFATSDVRNWLHTAAADLATTFDSRNGNDYYSKRLSQVPRLQRFATPFPIVRKSAK